MRILLLSLALTIPSLAIAQEALPLEKQEAVEEVQRALNDEASAVERGVTTKKGKCLQAIGDKEFCECVGENTPVAITFPDTTWR